MGAHTLYCSFCGKSQHEVKIIAGPAVFICNECTLLCSDILVQMDIEHMFANRLVTRASIVSFLEREAYTGADLMKEAFGVSLEGTGHEAITPSQVMTQLYGTLSGRLIPLLRRADLESQAADLEREIEAVKVEETEPERSVLESKQAQLAAIKQYLKEMPEVLHQKT